MLKLAQINNPALSPQLQGLTAVGFINQILPAVITLLLIAGAVLFLFMLLIGGIQWITAGGDKGAVETARSRITHALIGIFVLFSVWGGVSIIGGIVGINLTQFTFGSETISVIPSGQFASLGTISFSRLVSAFLTFGLVIAAVVFLFMLIAGGISWITAGGDKIALENARQRVVNALIGIIIVFSIFGIASVVGQFFGVPLLSFGTPIAPPPPSPGPSPGPSPSPVAGCGTFCGTNNAICTPFGLTCDSGASGQCRRATCLSSPSCVCPPTPTPTPQIGGGSCQCSGGTVTLNNCTAPAVATCTGSSSCACYIFPTPTLIPSRTPTPGPPLNPVSIGPGQSCANYCAPFGLSCVSVGTNFSNPNDFMKFSFVSSCTTVPSSCTDVMQNLGATCIINGFPASVERTFCKCSSPFTPTPTPIPLPLQIQFETSYPARNQGGAPTVRRVWLMVRVSDAGGNPINDATVTINVPISWAGLNLLHFAGTHPDGVYGGTPGASWGNCLSPGETPSNTFVRISASRTGYSTSSVGAFTDSNPSSI
ncbi:hypothetical protein HY008_00375, partial [Candidatus Woesebacteria bacterium]|nr:hypothetical protein [Candidatus Woesebacteria bacterium]